MIACYEEPGVLKDIMKEPRSQQNRSVISLIIPVYHEAECLNANITQMLESFFAVHVPDAKYPPSLEALNILGEHVEVLLVDGAQEQDTLAALHQINAWWKPLVIGIASPAGRALQMNTGASHARGDILFFVHIDTQLPLGALSLVRHAWQQGCKAGSFRLKLDSEGVWFRCVERLADWRNRMTKTPYGDQTQFFDRLYFERLGGYAAIPLMEDVEIMRRIRQQGESVCILPQAIVTSARRWHNEGILRCSLRNMILRTLFALGVSAHTLARWYRFDRS